MMFEHGDHGVKEKWRIDCRCAAPCAGTFNVSYDYKNRNMQARAEGNHGSIA